MVCNIGFRSTSYERISIPPYLPEVLRERKKAPVIDSDLLKKLGSEDSALASNLKTLNIKPLVEEALRRLKAKGAVPSGIRLTIGSGGNLEASASEDDATRRQLREVIAGWEMEIYGIAAELLGYTVQIQRTNAGFKLGGAKNQSGTDLPATIQVTMSPDDGAEVKFEHFASEEEIRAENVRWAALVQIMGGRPPVREIRISGAPIGAPPVGGHHRHDQYGRHVN